MGHHINAAGEFQSDKYPELKPDKIVVSFKHPEAWPALEALADGYEYKDPELAADIRQRLRAIGSTPPKAARDPDKFFLGSLTSWIATDVGGVPVKYIYPPPTMKAEWRIPVLGNDCDERAAEICELLNRMTFPEARAECEREQLNDQQRGEAVTEPDWRVHHVLTGAYKPWEVQTDHLGIYQVIGGEPVYLTIWKDGERAVTVHFGDRIITYERR